MLKDHYPIEEMLFNFNKIISPIVTKLDDDTFKQRLKAIPENDHVAIEKLIKYNFGKDADQIAYMFGTYDAITNIVDKHICKFAEQKKALKIAQGINIESVFPSRMAYSRAKPKIASLIVGMKINKVNTKTFDRLFRNWVLFEFSKHMAIYEQRLYEKEQKENPPIPKLVLNTP